MFQTLSEPVESAFRNVCSQFTRRLETDKESGREMFFPLRVNRRTALARQNGKYFPLLRQNIVLEPPAQAIRAAATAELKLL